MYFSVSEKDNVRGRRSRPKQPFSQPARATGHHTTVAELSACGSVHILCAYINNTADAQEGSLKMSKTRNAFSASLLPAVCKRGRKFSFSFFFFTFVQEMLHPQLEYETSALKEHGSEEKKKSKTQEHAASACI